MDVWQHEYELVHQYLMRHGEAPYPTLELWFARSTSEATLERIRARFGSFLAFLLYSGESSARAILDIRMRQHDGTTFVSLKENALPPPAREEVALVERVKTKLRANHSMEERALEAWLRDDQRAWSTLEHLHGSLDAFLSTSDNSYLMRRDGVVVYRDEWTCSVCKEENEGADLECRVCSVLRRRSGAPTHEPSVGDDFGIAQLLPGIIMRNPLVESLLARSVRVVLDEGRPLSLALEDDVDRMVVVDGCIVSSGDLKTVLEACSPQLRTNGHVCGCIGSTLHRCAVLRSGTRITGLTLTRARMIPPNSPPLTSVNGPLFSTSDSILLLGLRGVGKTAMLRHWAAVLAAHGKSVCAVDTHDELGGSAPTPHPSIGNARVVSLHSRRDLVVDTLRAVGKHHGASVVVIDDVSTVEEIRMCEELMRRGIKVLASCAASCSDEVPGGTSSFTHVLEMISLDTVVASL